MKRNKPRFKLLKTACLMFLKSLFFLHCHIPLSSALLWVKFPQHYFYMNCWRQDICCHFWEEVTILIVWLLSNVRHKPDAQICCWYVAYKCVFFCLHYQFLLMTSTVCLSFNVLTYTFKEMYELNEIL